MNHCGQSQLFSYCWAKRMRRIAFAARHARAIETIRAGPDRRPGRPRRRPVYRSRPCSAIEIHYGVVREPWKTHVQSLSVCAVVSASHAERRAVTLRQKRFGGRPAYSRRRPASRILPPRPGFALGRSSADDRERDSRVVACRSPRRRRLVASRRRRAVHRLPPLRPAGACSSQVINGVRVLLGPTKSGSGRKANCFRRASISVRPACANSCSPRTRWPKTRKRASVRLRRSRATAWRVRRPKQFAETVTVRSPSRSTQRQSLEAHLEGRRHGQQTAIRLRLHEHAQSTGAGDIVGIARDGKELVEGRVADGELRAEDAVPSMRSRTQLPASGSISWPLRGKAPWRRAHDALLVAQHDMPLCVFPG